MGNGMVKDVLADVSGDLPSMRGLGVNHTEVIREHDGVGGFGVGVRERNDRDIGLRGLGDVLVSRGVEV